MYLNKRLLIPKLLFALLLKLGTFSWDPKRWTSTQTASLRPQVCWCIVRSAVAGPKRQVFREVINWWRSVALMPSCWDLGGIQKKTDGTKKHMFFFIGFFGYKLLYIKNHRRSGTLGWFWLEITYELTEAEVNMITKSNSYTVDNISPSVYVFMCTHRWYVSMRRVLNIWYYDITYIYIQIYST